MTLLDAPRDVVLAAVAQQVKMCKNVFVILLCIILDMSLDI